MTSSERRVVAQCTTSMDGCSSGPGGPAEDTWLHEHAVTEASAAHYEGIWRGCSSAVVGRTNHEGFASVWPQITADPATDSRTRALGEWLAEVDTAVVSTTLEEPAWGRARVFRDHTSAIATLREEPGTDILVLGSATLIQSLLRDDLVDDLRLTVLPVLLGGGLRLLPTDVASTWELISCTTMAHGAVATHHRRAR